MVHGMLHGIVHGMVHGMVHGIVHGMVHGMVHGIVGLLRVFRLFNADHKGVQVQRYNTYFCH